MGGSAGTAAQHFQSSQRVAFVKGGDEVDFQYVADTAAAFIACADRATEGAHVFNLHGETVDDHRYDGNHCVATHDPKPWRKQFNILLAYASFYNPLNFVRAVVNWKDPIWHYRVIYQAYGMVGVVKSMLKGWGWLWSLYRGPVKKLDGLPRRRLEMIPPPVSPRQVAAWGLQLQSV